MAISEISPVISAWTSADVRTGPVPITMIGIYDELTPLRAVVT